MSDTRYSAYVQYKILCGYYNTVGLQWMHKNTFNHRRLKGEDEDVNNY